MSEQQSRRRELSPMSGALAVAGSTFVTGTSIFVTILAVVAASYQGQEVGLVEESRQASTSAQWWCYGLAVGSLVLGYVAARYGRSNVRVAAVVFGAFSALSVAVCALYVSAW
jgi:MFS family permease